MGSGAAESAISQAVAQYVVEATFADLPEDVQHESVRAFVNIFGCMMRGAQHEAVDIAVRALVDFSGPPEATLIGRGQRCDLLLASFINAMSAQSDAYSDTHAEMVLHPTAPVAAAILAVSQHRQISGEAFLLALYLGVEVSCRACKAITVAPARGTGVWQPGGVVGGIGAAIAAGKLLGLSRSQLIYAIAASVAEASGLRVNGGSMCGSSLASPRAAHSGLRAALLAEKGFVGSSCPFEGEGGFFEAFAEVSNPPALVGGLGESFEILSNTYKPFPCGVVIHPLIDACLQIKNTQHFGASEIENVKVKTHEVVIERCFRPDPRNGQEAIVSFQHWIAAALVRGDASLAQVRSSAIEDPELSDVRHRVEAEVDPTIARDEAVVTVHLKDGKAINCHVDHCIGSAENPMTDRDLERKFHEQDPAFFPPLRVQRLFDGCSNLRNINDVGDLILSAE